MHHFDPVTTLFNFLIVKVWNAGWNFGKQLVQAVALYYLVVVFVLFLCCELVAGRVRISSRP
jgi:hypothetical protein